MKFYLPSSSELTDVPWFAVKHLIFGVSRFIAPVLIRKEDKRSCTEDLVLDWVN